MVLFGLVFFLYPISAQDMEDWGNLTTDEQMDWESIEELCIERQLQPLPVNQLTKKQLEQFPFLTDALIEEILYYIYRNKPLLTLNELRGVKGMSRQVYAYLIRYVYIDEPNTDNPISKWKDWFKTPRFQLITQLKIPLQKRAGTLSYSKDELIKHPNIKYLGADFYHNIRTQLRFSQHVNISLNMEKDEGEPLFEPYAHGYDFISGYVQLKNIGRLKQLILGDFKGAFGYGLVMNTQFYLGKSLAVNTFHRMEKGLSASSSLQEYGYFRGLGAEIALTPYLNYTVMGAYTSGDATVDSLFIKSFITDGKHRLVRELEKKNSYTNTVIMNGLYLNKPTYELGLTMVYNHFNKMLNPALRAYNRFDPRGNDFLEWSAFYKWFRFPWIVSGEWAFDKQGGMAWQNRLSRQAIHNTFYVINRYYSKTYQSIFSNTFGENSKVRNELGCLIALENNIFRPVKILLTTDVFYFPYQKYRVSKSGTWGMDVQTSIQYSPSYSQVMFIKGSYKIKAADYRIPDTQERWVLPQARSRVVGEWRAQWDTWLDTRLSLQWIKSGCTSYSAANGWSVQMQGRMNWKKRWQCNVVAMGFNAPQYDARLYFYEPGLFGTYHGLSLYGKGFRISTILQYTFKAFNIRLKWGSTHYLDRSQIGSETETIQGSRASKLEFQFRYQLSSHSPSELSSH